VSDLKDRTRSFALRVIRLVSALPNSRVAWRLGDQLLRAGTSVGAHYREAIRARSKAEYVAKLNAGLMELEETLYWLELIHSAKLIPDSRLKDLMRESEELTAILVSLIKKEKPRRGPTQGPVRASDF
jgi:four helix bundle protein